MIQLLLVACCVFACPVLMGGMMWFMGRDPQGAKLEREVRRLNRDAARRRLTVAPASPLDEVPSQTVATESPDGPRPRGEEPSALATR